MNKELGIMNKEFRREGFPFISHNSLFLIHNSRLGFTLIELLIVFSLISLISALALASSVQSKRIRDLNSAGEQVLTMMRVAQAKALGGVNRVPWGMHLEASQVVVFQGSVYAGSPSLENSVLPSTVEIANINLVGGGSDILFSRLDGKTNQSGSFEIRIKNSLTDIYPITVDATGKSFRTGTIPTVLGTRETDTRHRNFNLAGTIKNSVTMTLTYSDPPNPDTIVPIAMLPAVPRTTFDWSATSVVGGQDQILRVHALSIDDSATLLSVDRNCEENSKKLKISFDLSDVVTYEADCETLTVWAFGGTVSEP